MNYKQTSLLAMVAGEVATIASIAGATTESRRLADLGFFEGALVRMVRPGAPCILRVGGATLAVGEGYQKVISVDDRESKTC